MKMVPFYPGADILAASPNETPAKKTTFLQKEGKRTATPDNATRRELVVGADCALNPRDR